MEFIESLRRRFSDAKLFGVGYSLGGNMLLKLLGELSIDSPFSAAISVSAPMQLDISANYMGRGFSRIYQLYLLKDLNKLLEIKCEMHNMKKLINLDKKDIKKLSSFWKFDEAYTAPIHGFDSAQDYYLKASSKQFLKHIKTHTLVIHSLDDPFMTPQILPKEDELSTSVKLEVYTDGGHVGFIEGTIFKPKYWLEKRVVKYFKEFV